MVLGVVDCMFKVCVCFVYDCVLFKMICVVLSVCLTYGLLLRLLTRECVLCLSYTSRCCMVCVCVLFLFVCVSCLNVFVWFVCDVLCGVVWCVLMFVYVGLGVQCVCVYCL